MSDHGRAKSIVETLREEADRIDVYCREHGCDSARELFNLMDVRRSIRVAADHFEQSANQAESEVAG